MQIRIKYDSAFWLHVTPFFSSTVTQQLQMYFGLTQLVQSSVADFKKAEQGWALLYLK